MPGWRWSFGLMAAALLLLAWTAGTRADPGDSEKRDPDRLSEQEQAVHLLNRAAFGPTPQEIVRVQQLGWEAWLDEQLTPEKIDDAQLEEALRQLKSLPLSNKALITTYNPQPKDNSDAERKRVEQLRRTPAAELQVAVLLRAVHSRCQLREVMVEFWRNHLTVSLDKDEVRYLATNYEHDVIRKHVFGQFEDMLLASAQHPAMLIYLDNQLSQKPLTPTELKYLKSAGDNKSRAQKNLLRQRGLNENYARELLELHTFGVDNGYTQRDVTELARVLTGWTLARGEEGDWNFWFRPEVHDTGSKRLLGQTIPSTKRTPTHEMGVAVVRGLARHENTAGYLALKLCRYLVDDDPPEEMVERVAAVFLESKGDLKATTRAVFTDPLFFHRRFYRSKFKTPFEYTVSLLRATGAEVKKPQLVLRYLQQMGQPIYRCPDPTGYYDTREAWLDPGVLALRWQLALDLAEERGGAVKYDGALLRQLGRLDPEGRTVRAQLVRLFLPAGLDPSLDAVLDQLLARKDEFPEEAVRRRILGLALGSPEFQKQ